MAVRTSAQEIASLAAGETCWRAERGHGSFLTFDLGRRLPGLRDRGEWHLWVYFGSWVLHDRDGVLATSEDAHAVIDAAIERFSGKRLHDVVVDPRSLQATFTFEEAMRVEVGPNRDAESPEADWWLLFTPGEQVLVVGPGPSWTYQSSDEP